MSSRLSFDFHLPKQFNHRPRAGEECMSKFLRSHAVVGSPRCLHAGSSLCARRGHGRHYRHIQDATERSCPTPMSASSNRGHRTVTRATKTDDTGSFTATLLPVATYTVNITSGGFREAKIPASRCALRKPHA